MMQDLERCSPGTPAMCKSPRPETLRPAPQKAAADPLCFLLQAPLLPDHSHVGPRQLSSP